MARDKKAKTKKRISKLPASVSALLQYLGGTQATIGAGRVIGKPTEISPIDLLTKIITQQPQYLQQQQQQNFKEDVRKIIEEERQARLLSQQESKKLQEKTLSSLEELKTQYEGSVFGKDLLMEKLQQMTKEQAKTETQQAKTETQKRRKSKTETQQANTETQQMTKEQEETTKSLIGRKSNVQKKEEQNIKKQQEQEQRLYEAGLPPYTSSLTEIHTSSLQSEGIADTSLLIQPEEESYSTTEGIPTKLPPAAATTAQYSTPNLILPPAAATTQQYSTEKKLTLETTQAEKIKMYNDQLIRGGLSEEEEKKLRREIRMLQGYKSK